MPEHARAEREPPKTAVKGPETTPRTAPAPDADAIAQGDVDATAAAYGNQAGAGTAPQPIADQVPSVLDLAEIGASFEVPADRELTDDWNQVSTGVGGTRVWISLSATALRVSMWPPMVVDVQWPLSNVAWQGFTYDFRTGNVTSVDVANTQTPFAFGARTFVDSAVRDYVQKLVAGTSLAKPGYDPLHDADSQGTLRALQANAAGGTAGATPVGANEVTGLTSSATFKTRSAIRSDGISIPAGTTLSVSAGLPGSLEDLQGAGLTRVEWVSLTTDGIELSQDGAPVAKLLQVTLKHGGALEVGRWEPLGKLREYGQTESGLRGLFLLLQLGALRSGSNPGPLATNLDAEVVEGVAEGKIEGALGDAVRTLITDHHDAIPGLDLRAVLGVGAPGR